ncbi:MAG: hypothetical protein AAGD38_24735, partial [Acidobacteriota bacterium]
MNMDEKRQKRLEEYRQKRHKAKGADFKPPPPPREANFLLIAISLILIIGLGLYLFSAFQAQQADRQAEFDVLSGSDAPVPVARDTNLLSPGPYRAEIEAIENALYPPAAEDLENVDQRLTVAVNELARRLPSTAEATTEVRELGTRISVLELNRGSLADVRAEWLALRDQYFRSAEWMTRHRLRQNTVSLDRARESAAELVSLLQDVESEVGFGEATDWVDRAAAFRAQLDEVKNLRPKPAGRGEAARLGDNLLDEAMRLAYRVTD